MTQGIRVAMPSSVFSIHSFFLVTEFESDDRSIDRLTV